MATSVSLRSVVADNIRAHAERRGMTLDSVADFAGVSRRQLYNFLAGKSDITLGWLEKVAHALQVEPSILVVHRRH